MRCRREQFLKNSWRFAKSATVTTGHPFHTPIWSVLKVAHLQLLTGSRMLLVHLLQLLLNLRSNLPYQLRYLQRGRDWLVNICCYLGPVAAQQSPIHGLKRQWLKAHSSNWADSTNLSWLHEATSKTSAETRTGHKKLLHFVDLYPEKSPTHICDWHNAEICRDNICCAKPKKRECNLTPHSIIDQTPSTVSERPY